MLVDLKKAVHQQTELQKSIAMEKAAEAQRTYENTTRLMWIVGSAVVAPGRRVGLVDHALDHASGAARARGGQYGRRG